jgi:anti-anti-sigma factor
MAVEDYKLPRIGRHGVVTLPAEVDVTNADEIRQALLTAASHGAAVLIIDMSGTTLCDSAGVGAIIAAVVHDDLRHGGLRFAPARTGSLTFVA